MPSSTLSSFFRLAWPGLAWQSSVTIGLSKAFPTRDYCFLLSSALLYHPSDVSSHLVCLSSSYSFNFLYAVLSPNIQSQLESQGEGHDALREISGGKRAMATAQSWMSVIIPSRSLGDHLDIHAAVLKF